MKNVKYILIEDGSPFYTNLTIVVDDNFNQNITDKVADDKIVSIYRNTMDVLINVEYTIYDKHQG